MAALASISAGLLGDKPSSSPVTIAAITLQAFLSAARRSGAAANDSHIGLNL
jgi:hypothetical protein